MKKSHDVFPVVKLELAQPDPISGRHPEPPPPPLIIDGEEEFEVDKVINVRLRYRKPARRAEYEMLFGDCPKEP